MEQNSKNISKEKTPQFGEIKAFKWLSFVLVLHGHFPTENMKAQIAGHWFYPIMIADEKGEIYKLFDLGRSKGWRAIPMRSVRRLITPRVPLRSFAVSLHAPAAKLKVVPPNRFAFSHRFSGSLFLFTRTAKIGLAGKKSRLYEWAAMLIFYRPAQP